MILKGEDLNLALGHAHMVEVQLARFHRGGAELERTTRLEQAAEYLRCPLTPKGVLAGDVVTEKQMSLTRACIQLITHWNPRTQVVEFYGGPYDGTVRQIQKVGEVVHCYVGPIFPNKTAQESRGEDPFLMDHRLTYQLEGWNLAKNIWAYRLDRPHMPARAEGSRPPSDP